MSWRDHIVTGAEAGTRPVLKRTRDAVEDILVLLANGAEFSALHLTSEELQACFQYVSELIPNPVNRRAEPGGTKLHVTARQLEQAFRRHNAAGWNDAAAGWNDAAKDDSFLLLLIYAIECGLKRLILEELSLKNTRDLAPEALTHDLNALLALLGQSKKFSVVKLDNPEEDVPPQRIHEALRYGRPLRRESRDKLMTKAREVIEYIKEYLP